MKKNPRLYGITNSNRSGDDLWGKNQFNSTFPTSLACFMRDQGINAVYVNLRDGKQTHCSEIAFSQVFNSDLPNDQLYFDFESNFEPFEAFVEKKMERVDLVVREAVTDKNGKTVGGKALQALEVKLTVTPDNTTASRSDQGWFPEIVIRPATMKYLSLSIASAINPDEIRPILDPVGIGVKQWGNETEATKILPRAVEALDNILETFHVRQKPLIMQPIWRTTGKRPLLDTHAFDIFVWSNFALLRVTLDQASKEEATKISRYSRSALRVARYLYEYGRGGRAHIENLFSDMTYELQSDKEFALNGTVTKRYMNHPRMQKPALKKDIIAHIILDGGEELLSPERRLDQTILLSVALARKSL